MTTKIYATAKLIEGFQIMQDDSILFEKAGVKATYNVNTSKE